MLILFYFILFYFIHTMADAIRFTTDQNIVTAVTETMIEKQTDA